MKIHTTVIDESLNILTNALLVAAGMAWNSAFSELLHKMSGQKKLNTFVIAVFVTLAATIAFVCLTILKHRIKPPIEDTK